MGDLGRFRLPFTPGRTRSRRVVGGQGRGLKRRQCCVLLCDEPGWPGTARRQGRRVFFRQNPEGLIVRCGRPVAWAAGAGKRRRRRRRHGESLAEPWSGARERPEGRAKA